VIRISEKINEIHSNIEKGRMGKSEEYEKKVGTLEEKFDEAIDTSEKKFEMVDGQLQQITAYLNKDKRNKDEILRQKREEIALREQEMN